MMNRVLTNTISFSYKWAPVILSDRVIKNNIKNVKRYERVAGLERWNCIPTTLLNIEQLTNAIQHQSKNKISIKNVENILPYELTIGYMFIDDVLQVDYEDKNNYKSSIYVNPFRDELCIHDNYNKHVKLFSSRFDINDPVTKYFQQYVLIDKNDGTHDSFIDDIYLQMIK